MIIIIGLDDELGDLYWVTFLRWDWDFNFDVNIFLSNEAVDELGDKSSHGSSSQRGQQSSSPFIGLLHCTGGQSMS